MADGENIESVNVCVAVRCRPINGKEMAEGSSSIVEFPGDAQVFMNNGKDKHQYAFDHAFSSDSRQEVVYKELGIALLDQAFNGYNSTIFAYGQTGSGKTHTMLSHRAKEEDRGLIPRISDELYNRIDKITAEHESRKFLVCCSFLEIYNEVIYDLLVPRAKQAKGGLEVREQKGIGVYVKDLTEMVIESSTKLNQIIEQGFSHRSTAATKMNDASSRSHCIFVIKLHQKDDKDQANNTFSKLNLVDLAGSERAKSTEAEGDRLKEGANINKSLSALGNVINALSSIASGNKKVFVPYRNSKLTRVLQESLGGNSLCTMVATISPSSTNWEETLSTLNYAKRAKTIKVTAVRNDEASQIKKLEDEVNALRRKLEQQVSGAELGMGAKEKEELEGKYENQIVELQGFMQQSWEEKQQITQEYEENQRKVKMEAEKAAERVKAERKRRMQLMEESGDIQMSLQALRAIGSKLVKGWPDRIADALKVEQQLRSQLHAVKLYRESAAADFKMCTGCGVGDPVAMMTLLNQVHGKLGSMTNELESLKKLETQFEEQMGRITPEVALAVKDAQTAMGKASTNDEQSQLEELIELLTLVGRQLGKHQSKVRSFGREEKRKLEFDSEFSWLLQCLKEDGASANPDRAALLTELQEAKTRVTEAAASATTEMSSSDSTQNLPQVLGLSTMEFPDEKLGASSNVEAARSARLHQAMTYGGWCPNNDSPNEYLEVDLGKESHVTGVSIQGRLPCTSEWCQTRDLLQMALAGSSDKLPTAEKVFKRPPVRLIHDVTVALANEHGCFGTGDSAWRVPEELLNYADLGREQKVTFFEELIKRVEDCWTEAQALGLKQLAVTPQEILTGKNCEETNRLLQLLAFLGLKAQNPSMGGLLDAAPQWMEKWTLSYLAGDSWNKVVATGSEAPQVFDGNADESTPKFVTLPGAVKATRIRIHPVAWRTHPAARLEIHFGSASTPTPASPSRSQGGVGSSLEVGVQLTRKGILEVQRGIDERQRSKREEEDAKAAEVNALKDKAEQERDRLEQNLKDALQKVEELEAARTASEQRAVTAETTLLQMQVERDRLSSQVEQLETDLAARTEAKAQAEEQIATLRSENEELSRSAEDLTLQLQVMKEERDVARAKEEEYYDTLCMKDEDLMDTNNGYVYLTERLQEKEEEMENVSEQVSSLKDANEKLDQRCKELQDEGYTLRVEQQKLRTKLAEEERMHKAAQDRYMKMLKDGMGGFGANNGSRPETGSTAPEPPISTKDRVQMNATPNSTGSYEDDFDEQ